MSDSILSLIHVKQPDKSHLVDDLETFNHLIKEVEDLQKKQEKTAHDLDQSLSFFYEKIYPEEKAFLNLCNERILIFYRFYKTQSGFTAEDLKKLRKVILAEIDWLFSILGTYGVPVEIREINLELHGTEPKEPDPEPARTEEEKSPPPPPQEEMKTETIETPNERDLREMEKKSLGTIYKRLVKAYHPDLELDAGEKILKSEIMKKITAAYESHNLYELLALERELLGETMDQKEVERIEQLTVYNSILKEQVEVLRGTINNLIYTRKYLPIQRYFRNQYAPNFTMNMEYQKLKGKVEELDAHVKLLRTVEAEAIVKQMVSQINLDP